MTTIRPKQEWVDLLREIGHGKFPPYLYGVRKKNGSVKWHLHYYQYHFTGDSEADLVRRLHMVISLYGFI